MRSVADFGCGQGVWLREWWNRGVRDVFGIDGESIDAVSLLIPASQFMVFDLGTPLSMRRRFDLVMCLEVAEHLDEKSADILVDNLTTHSDVVLFSGATPGQGGLSHVNEQPFEYWRKRFQSRGYDCYDFIRRSILENHDVEACYRYNSLLFLNAEGQKRLSSEALNSRVPEFREIQIVSPLAYRWRCKLLSYFNPPTISLMAKIRHRLLRV